MTRLRIGVVGALGRMGRAVSEAIARADDLALAAAIVRPGQARGEGGGPGGGGPPLRDDLDSAVSQCDVLVDFSLPDVFDALVEAAIRHRVPLVSGTTGLTPGQLARLDRLALVAPCVHSPNMSLGIQVLLDLAGRAARALGPAYDLAVVESHHRHKKDAPSGTAKRILEALAQASAPALAADAIPTFSVRGGDVVGDHTVHFLGPGDRIELTHRATSRETFANGALRAARWLVEQPAGRYELRQVLGL